MGKFFIGMLVGLLLIPVSAYLYVRSGRAPVATSAPPLPFERFFVKTALHATIDRDASRTMTAPAGNRTVAAGARIYRQNCAVCHGLPGQPPAAEAKGMYPHPPQFFRPGAKTIDDPFWEVFWKVRNGIRMTGMPSFGATLSNTQISEVGALLEDANKLPATVTMSLDARSQAAYMK